MGRYSDKQGLRIFIFYSYVWSVMRCCQNIYPWPSVSLITDKNDPRPGEGQIDILLTSFTSAFSWGHSVRLSSPLLSSPSDNLHDKACWMIGRVWQSHSSSLIWQSLPASHHDPVLSTSWSFNNTFLVSFKDLCDICDMTDDRHTHINYYLLDLC